MNNSNSIAAAPSRDSLQRRTARLFGQWGVFLRGFIEHPKMVGSIIPSSRFTIDKMLAPVDWPNCQLFVEYGPGVGTFCLPVLDRLPADGAMIAIDTNPLYVDFLNQHIHDPRFTAVLGSAEHVERIVRDHGHERADYIVSGLPFSTLPEGVGPAIMAATHRILRPGGAFMAYQFTAAVRDLMAREFDDIESDYEFWNVLPCKLFWGWKDGAEG
ncbi:class I SAM-dependent methyltransferase [Erythrobacter sp. 3-20A1M]|uniref:class I SAM-dependent methyltransferase n=1 Tax=Erythrobacter sp. 3-20A1M TaxID=2653850 RepID=UPI00203CA775|nr:methyltransferase domain-containing protein [Erythrobacter sp. 3-20A1M]